MAEQERTYPVYCCKVTEYGEPILLDEKVMLTQPEVDALHEWLSHFVLDIHYIRAGKDACYHDEVASRDNLYDDTSTFRSISVKDSIEHLMLKDGFFCGFVFHVYDEDGVTLYPFLALGERLDKNMTLFYGEGEDWYYKSVYKLSMRYREKVDTNLFLPAVFSFPQHDPEF